VTRPVTQHSPLESCHLALGATMIEFAGWMMPVRYSSDLAEHEAVRTGAGLFDLSHMGEITVVGPGACEALDSALVGWSSRIEGGRAKYTMICAEDGGIIDDLIVYRLASDRFMIVANAGNAVIVVGEIMDRCREFECEVSDESSETALVAVQGPRALEVVTTLLSSKGGRSAADLLYYSSATVVVDGSPTLLARTGYTGEDGFEFFCPAAVAERLWNLALDIGASAGIVPCGLAARDTLRLEAGMPLYGHELSLERTPFEAGLGRVVRFGDSLAARGDFIGRSALESARERVRTWKEAPSTASDDARMLVGLTGEGKRSARGGYSVYGPEGVTGEVASGTPSPTLGHPIAMAYVHPRHMAIGANVEVDVRGRREKMTVTALPFYKRQK